MAFTITYSITDGKGKQSTTEVNLPSTTAFTDVLLFASQMAVLLDDMIAGRIERIGITATVDMSTLTSLIKQTAGTTSDVEEGGRFNFRTANGFFTAMRIPTFLEDKIVTGTDVVDVADTDVAAYLTAMRTGINLTAAGGSGTIQPADKRDEDIVSLDSATESFLSS